MKITEVLEQLLKGQDLSADKMRQIMQACMQGELTDVQIAAFLALMRMKGETIEELSAAAKVMLELAHTIDLGDDLIDIVGTGGDGKNTFNVSTVSSIVVAAAGVRVAKHGNRSVSGRSGSADLLEQAGFKLQLSDGSFQECIKRFGLCFLFAPHFHPAMRQVQNARRELGLRSFFNLLGPLMNPARVKRQVVGVFDKRWQMPLAEVLASLGSERALVLCSQDGMDEISIAAPTDIVEYHQGKFTKWTLNPARYNCAHSTIDDIVVKSPAESLRMIHAVLQAEKGAARDIVLLNSAATIYCAGKTSDFDQALNLAENVIDSGAGLTLFNQLRDFTQHTS